MAVIDGEDAKVLFDADAAKGFAKEVLDKFRACKVPLERASQQDLNALARAYFMMDKTEEGFALFQMVKATRSPDMYDVNVVLSGVAKYNVELASRMIDRMHERGLVPNAVTWGTVIHLAFLKGDMELMISLVRRAQERGTSEFTARTIGTLIRASVSDVPSWISVSKSHGHPREQGGGWFIAVDVRRGGGC
jgi:pentatricopeptide repeat protein